MQWIKLFWAHWLCTVRRTRTACSWRGLEPEEEQAPFMKPRKWSSDGQQSAGTSPVTHFEQRSIAESLFLAGSCVGCACRETWVSTWDSWPETHLRSCFLLRTGQDWMCPPECAWKRGLMSWCGAKFQAAAEQVLEASLGVCCFYSQYNLSILEPEAGLLLGLVLNWERLTAEKNGLGHVTELVIHI